MKEKKHINMEIGLRIKQAREAAGLTQDRFAELIGMGTKNVSAIERGVVGISLVSIQKICQVLAVSSDALLFGRQAENEAHDLAARLERLPSEQLRIARDILNKLLEAFALSDRNENT